MTEKKQIDTSSKEISYCLEMIKSLYDKDYKDFRYLYNVQASDPAKNPFERILTVLDIFENIIDVNTYGEFNQASVNRIISQFVNINQISRGESRKFAYSLKVSIEQIRNNIRYGDNFVPSQGFAQEGEDLILKRLFLPDKIGFYVDIGAHHPTRFSNTYLFYRKGWRGITVDPLPGSAEIFAEMRPEDIHVQVSIGSGKESDQKAEYLMFEESAYNCILIDGQEQPNLQASKIIDRVPVAVKSLDNILEENADAFEQIDLLSIDVEGYEEEVMAGFSLEEYLPKVVVVEIRGFDIESGWEHPLYKRLIANGYKLRSILYHSLIFVQEARNSVC